MTTYYVDLTDGDDANDGLSTAAPKLTPPALSANDTLLIKRGSSGVVTGHANVATGCTISTYGTGAKPIISKAITMTGSITGPDGNGEYYYEIPASRQGYVGWVFQNGSPISYGGTIGSLTTGFFVYATAAGVKTSGLLAERIYFKLAATTGLELSAPGSSANNQSAFFLTSGATGVRIENIAFRLIPAPIRSGTGGGTQNNHTVQRCEFDGCGGPHNGLGTIYFAAAGDNCVVRGCLFENMVNSAIKFGADASTVHTNPKAFDNTFRDSWQFDYVSESVGGSTVGLESHAIDQAIGGSGGLFWGNRLERCSTQDTTTAHGRLISVDGVTDSRTWGNTFIDCEQQVWVGSAQLSEASSGHVFANNYLLRCGQTADTVHAGCLFLKNDLVGANDFDTDIVNNLFEDCVYAAGEGLVYVWAESANVSGIRVTTNITGSGQTAIFEDTSGGTVSTTESGTIATDAPGIATDHLTVFGTSGYQAGTTISGFHDTYPNPNGAWSVPPSIGIDDGGLSFFQRRRRAIR